MEISASMVKELRERTGAGMMDCKKALTETNGAIEKAVELLREKGLAAAAKKAGRIAAEGLVKSYVSSDQRVGALVEVNCETDFVAKTDQFHEFVAGLAEQIAIQNPQTISAEDGGEGPYLLEQEFKDGRTVQDQLNQMVATIGEKISARRFIRFETSETGLIQDYLHMGGKIGVLLELSFSQSNPAGHDEFVTLAKDLAMQIAAAKPEYIRKEEIPSSVIEKEKAIYKAQAVNEGKPEKVAEKITMGRLQKFYKETCLEEQEFIKDSNLTVGKLISELSQKSGSEIKVLRFARFEKGEGLERREDDFVSEVISQMKG